LQAPIRAALRVVFLQFVALKLADLFNRLTDSTMASAQLISKRRK
jgi:hypothetical protein